MHFGSDMDPAERKTERPLYLCFQFSVLIFSHYSPRCSYMISDLYNLKLVRIKWNSIEQNRRMK